mgnify:CR=1 FL=1
MPLLSDRTAFDQLAGQRAQAGVDSQHPVIAWTIHEACDALQWPYPTTDIQFRHFAQLCDTWRVRTNVSEESWWKRVTAEGND